MAVLVEQFQPQTGFTEVSITEEAIEGQSDLTAWRHEDSTTISLRARR